MNANKALDLERKAKALSGMRFIICGKGGSGKSSILALMNLVLKERGNQVHIIDGDAAEVTAKRHRADRDRPL